MLTTATNDEAALRAAAKANPLDPTPRLVLADHLDELDRPLDAALQRVLAEPDDDRHRLDYASACERLGDATRAEFIWVQVELDKIDLRDALVDGSVLAAALAGYYLIKPIRLRDGYFSTLRDTLENNPDAFTYYVPNSECKPGFIRLRDRERDLVIVNRRSWSGSCLEIVPTEVGLEHWVRFSRGFVSELRCDAADWIDHADTLTELHPIARVRLTTMPNYEWQMENLGPDWLIRIRPDWTKTRTYGPQYLAQIALEYRWPRITFELPPTQDGWGTSNSTPLQDLNLYRQQILNNVIGYTPPDRR